MQKSRLTTGFFVFDLLGILQHDFTSAPLESLPVAQSETVLFRYARKAAALKNLGAQLTFLAAPYRAPFALAFLKYARHLTR
jgi:hypothetical protein